MSSSDEENNCTRNIKNKLGSMMEEEDNNNFGQAKLSLGLKKFPRDDDSDDDIERDNMSDSSFNSKQKDYLMCKAKSEIVKKNQVSINI